MKKFIVLVLMFFAVVIANAQTDSIDHDSTSSPAVLSEEPLFLCHSIGINQIKVGIDKTKDTLVDVNFKVFCDYSQPNCCSENQNFTFKITHGIIMRKHDVDTTLAMIRKTTDFKITKIIVEVDTVNYGRCGNEP